MKLLILWILTTIPGRMWREAPTHIYFLKSNTFLSRILEMGSLAEVAVSVSMII